MLMNGWVIYYVGEYKLMGRLNINGYKNGLID